MSLKFTEAFDKLLEKIPNSEEAWSKDDEAITQKIYQAFHDTNSIFKGTLSHLKQTNILKKNYQSWIQLKMPFPITARKQWEGTTAVGYKLRAGRNVRHPAVQNRHAVPEMLRSLFDTDLKRAVGSIGEVTCQSGRVYILNASSDPGDIDLYSIDATSFGIGDKKELCYYFEVDLQFLNDPNIYIPYFGHPMGAQFMVRNEPFSLDKKTMGNALSVLKFLEHLGVEQNEETKKAYLQENIKNRPVSDAVLETLKYVISVSENPDRLSSIHKKLEHFKQVDSVELSELMALIDLN